MKRITKVEDMVVGRWYHLTPKERTSISLCGIYQLVAKDETTGQKLALQYVLFFGTCWYLFDSFSSIVEIEVENG